MARKYRTSRWTAVAFASAAVALTVAACGTAHDDTSRGNGNCATPGVTANEIKVGLLYPSSGAASGSYNAVRAGVEARLDAANTAGGVNGRRLSYLWQDDASVSETNLAGAQKLINDDQVFGIIETTTVAKGSATFLHDHGIPVTGIALEPVWTVNDNMFTFVNFVGPGSISTWGDFVTAQGGRTALILKGAFDEALSDTAEKMGASLRSAGVRVVGTVDVSPQADPVRLGAQIRNSGADTLVGLLGPETFDQAVIGARNAGVPLKVAMSFSPGYDRNLLWKYGRQIAGTSYFLDYAPFELDTSGHRAFLNAVGRYAPELQPPAQGGALSGWISADMMIRGLQTVGSCPTRGQFIRGLRAVGDYSADGLLPVALDMTRSFGQMNTCFTFVKVSDDGTRFGSEPTARCGHRI
ncbi:ABC transporter substrate-binding protein [Frankia sp. Cppng1_Ct_nod]|uniref:ABC transporter substrate-binding protein n=1 Tax=Frankia sp. Cppng1_Ct_nod TaxID=2897162 RepID=UPI00104192EE|nr:ABC transporter substrate-binding protein [Frankia sp. Cppng1_Ct_nod]